MNAKRKEYQVVSSHLGKETGRLILKDSTRGEANTFARTHSRYLKGNTVQVFLEKELISSFQRGLKLR